MFDYEQFEAEVDKVRVKRQSPPAGNEVDDPTTRRERLLRERDERERQRLVDIQQQQWEREQEDRRRRQNSQRNSQSGKCGLFFMSMDTLVPT